jgi:pyrroloquinoline quinone biosynthesis protein E
MDGWGRRFMVIRPDGLVLPCHVAHTLPGIAFDCVRDRALAEIWNDSPGLNTFRGEDWMPEPCRSCERRTEDFGGCRCQAFHLTGNATVTDPACSLSPHHAIVEAARGEANLATPPPPWQYRQPRTPVVAG